MAVIIPNYGSLAQQNMPHPLYTLKYCTSQDKHSYIITTVMLCEIHTILTSLFFFLGFIETATDQLHNKIFRLDLAYAENKYIQFYKHYLYMQINLKIAVFSFTKKKKSTKPYTASVRSKLSLTRYTAQRSGVTSTSFMPSRSTTC